MWHVIKLSFRYRIQLQSRMLGNKKWLRTFCVFNFIYLLFFYRKLDLRRHPAMLECRKNNKASRIEYGVSRFYWNVCNLTFCLFHFFIAWPFMIFLPWHFVYTFYNIHLQPSYHKIQLCFYTSSHTTGHIYAINTLLIYFTTHSWNKNIRSIKIEPSFNYNFTRSVMDVLDDCSSV